MVLARRTNLPIQPVQRETAGLERIGLLRATLKGRQKFFAVNLAHPIFPELHALVIKTSGIVEPMREILVGAARSQEGALSLNGALRPEADGSGDRR